MNGVLHFTTPNFDMPADQLGDRHVSEAYPKTEENIRHGAEGRDKKT